MNFILHLSVFYDKILQDDRISPTHISLYMALFQFWNYNRFKNTFTINRREVMIVSKIASVATYHKCIKELHHFGYIIYEPSYNPFSGSLVTIIENFSTKDNEKLNFEADRLKNNRKLNLISPEIKPSNFIKPSFSEVRMYFLEREQPEEEAMKFFNYYEKSNWLKYKNVKMKSWQSAARNWIINSNKSLKSNQDFYSLNKN